MRFIGDCYRAHHPAWAFSPLSGAGAAVHGGRFNARGVPALYLALTIDGAVAEASQGFAFRMEPLTLCLYAVDCADLVDLRTSSGRDAAGVSSDALSCAWFLDVAEGRTPASWSLASRLASEGAAGVLVPSFARGAKADAANLVLWRWGEHAPHRVAVHDPSGRLPESQLSWPAT